MPKIFEEERDIITNGTEGSSWQNKMYCLMFGGQSHFHICGDLLPVIEPQNVVEDAIWVGAESQWTGLLNVLSSSPTNHAHCQEG